MREEILNILLLREVNAIRRGRDLETKEVTKRTQTRHQEFFTKKLLAEINEPRIITSNVHIIDVEKKKRKTMRKIVDKESEIVVARLKTSISDNGGKMLKL